ncbi:MAG: hypothetical protein CMD85_03515 [Gammaproteobacteria bacterium]|nr:hypothetical protein [Gammaproteobacteria bacterium]
MNHYKKLVILLFCLIYTSSCSNNFVINPNIKQGFIPIEKPKVNYKYNKLPKIINIILENSYDESSTQFTKGVIANYFYHKETKGYSPKLNFFYLDKVSLDKCNLKNLKSNHSILFINLEFYKKIQKNCLREIINLKGVIVNLDNKEIEKGNVINVSRTKDFKNILSFARNKNNSSLIMTDKLKGQESSIESTWKGLGGNVIFSNKQEGTNRSLSELLLLESSKERKRRLSRNLSIPLEGTPRRRQDLDSLIISSSISKARSLKPELDYNFGESLTVYFIPEWNNNEVYSKRELDLNDIYLVDMPWMFNTQSYVSERNSLKKNRNFALGFDSLETLLLQLNPSSSNKFIYKGLSGQITYQKGSLKRKSLKAQVKEGSFEFIDY